MQIDSPSPIDEILTKIKPLLFANFAKKWVAHTHDIPDCMKTITLGGIWKTVRDKCCYEAMGPVTEEFGIIPFGCTFTPIRGSYHCALHKDK